jgi:imidazolonepropionase
VSVQLFVGARQVVTAERATSDCVLSDAAVAVQQDRIVAVGPQAALLDRYERAERIDCAGGVVTPGFVDSHTHAVFGGHRAAEYALRARGVPYMEIARRGGGINASIRDVRALSEDVLHARSSERVRRALRAGTTTLEIKSGYGLDPESELKQLRVVRALRADGYDVIATFLGAHEFPPEYRDRRDEYVRLLVEAMIPAVAAAGLATFCDVFCEPGVFTPAQTRTILAAGRAHGLLPKLHADELENSGGAELAAELGAASADHLGAISEAGIAALAAAPDTVATLLPTTLLFLGKTHYAPARALLDAGASVALASDYNPGSSPTWNMPLVMTLACSQMRMDPLEALVAATAGGARALRLADRGVLRAGAVADLVVWDVEDCNEIAYHFGAPPLRAVFKRGRRVD